MGGHGNRFLISIIVAGAVVVLTEALAGNTSKAQGLTGRVAPVSAEGSLGRRSPPRAARPRLWLDSETEGRLAGSARRGDPAWSVLQEFCDNSGTKPDWDYQGYQRYRYVANFALCYRVAKRAGLGESVVDRYGAKALAVLVELTEFDRYSTDSGYGIRNYLPALATAYDWLYDYPGLTAPIKDQTRRRMQGWLEWYERNGYARANDNNPIPVYLSNYNAGYLVGRVMASIAMFGDGAGTERYFDDAVVHQAEALTVFDRYLAGGHWPEGWNYGASAYTFHGQAASVVRHATGSSGIARSNWLRDNIRLKLHALSPDGRYFYDDGAWTGSHIGNPSIGDMYVAGSLAGWGSPEGGLAAAYVRLARNWSQDGVRADQGVFVGEWRALLFFDPKARAADLNSEQKSYRAPGAGLVLWRSGWNQPEATWGSFVAGPYLSWQGGQDLDQGHIEIYKGAPLLVDAGHKLYGADQVNGTVHHNTITLHGRRGDVFMEKGRATTGQRQFGHRAGCSQSRLGVQRYEDGGEWLLAGGELTDAYRPPQRPKAACLDPGITRLERNVFVVRPDLLLVFDMVEKHREQLQVVPQLNFHFPVKPEVGTTPREVTVRNGRGRLDGATVWPVDAAVRLVPNSDSGGAVPGWHYAVTAAKGGVASERFLHVFRASESGTRVAALSYGAISGAQAYGVWIDERSGSKKAQRIAVLWAEEGAAGGRNGLTYSADGVDRHFILNLRPAANFVVETGAEGGKVTVRIREDRSGPHKSSDGGVLRYVQ